MSFRARPSRPDRAKAIAAVALVHAAMATLLLIRPASPDAPPDEPPPVLIDIAPPPPPPPPIDPAAGRTREAEGAAGKKADPSPVVAPPPRIPTPTPLPAAPVAGTGSAATAGAAEAGTGPGAGGSGTGRGGGGSGGGTEAQLLGGNRSRLPSRLLRQFAADRGYAHLWLTITTTGRATDCSVLRGTGNAEVDQSLCGLMISQSRWAPARDRQGRPITGKKVYTATWSKD